ncbi:hypothetical protein HDV00_010861 [Rhizophlyctis rosea]|nr:hypothetical protein HDV00_010861 [Rhizophlyctis rosea]
MIARLTPPPACHYLRFASKRTRALISFEDVVWAEAGWRRYTQGLQKCWRWAVTKGHLEIVTTYIHDVKAKDLVRALGIAAEKGHLELVMLFIEDCSVDVHSDDDHPLKLASQHGHYEVVKYLIDVGADVHAGDDNALDHAAYGGHLEVVNLLIGAGANVVAAGPGFPLYFAASQGHSLVVQALLNAGADVHRSDDYAIKQAATAAVSAAAAKRSVSKYLDSMEVLLRAGADLEGIQLRVLEIAAGEGRVEIVKAWLHAGMSIQSDGGECVALIEAAKGGHMEVVKLLLVHGVSNRNSCNRALAGATLGGHTDIINAMIWSRVADFRAFLSAQGTRCRQHGIQVWQSFDFITITTLLEQRSLHLSGDNIIFLLEGVSEKGDVEAIPPLLALTKPSFTLRKALREALLRAASHGYVDAVGAMLRTCWDRKDGFWGMLRGILDKEVEEGEGGYE